MGTVAVLMWPLLFWWTYSLLGILAFPWLGLFSKPRRHLYNVPTPNPGAIWIHGASAGEQQAARAIANVLEGPVWRTFSSWRTPVPDAFPAPLDVPFTRGRWLDKARPKMLILIEAELWPGWLYDCRKREIPVVVVNARNSKSQKYWSRLKLWNWLVREITWFNRSKTGDLKTGAPVIPPPFHINRDYVLGACTHKGEEKILIDAWSKIANRPLLIIAPRRIERSKAILSLCSPHKAQLRSDAPLLDHTQILILDSFGELASLYPDSSCAFIGGTFNTDVGDHSPAEAIAAGTPYLFGPNIHNNRDVFPRGNGTAVKSPDLLEDALRDAMNKLKKPQRADVEGLVDELPSFNCPKETEARPHLKPFVGLWVKWGGRQKSYADTPEKPPLPVISVGGLSSGGTGKTPICAWLAEQADNVWISSRGYRRPSSGPHLRTGEGMGDEAEMLRRRGHNVVSCPDRVKAAHFAAENGASALVVDDGFQYKRLQRQLNICCINVRWPRSRGQIPVGWAREEWNAHERANILWLHNYHPDLPIPPMSNRPKVRSRLVPSHWLHKGVEHPLNHVSGTRVVAAGIAHPSGFMTTLHQLGIGISKTFLVADHGQLPRLPRGCLVTEKDAARLPVDADVWTLCMKLEIENSHLILDQLSLCLSSPEF